MKTSERRENLFNHWTALCENENAQTRIPRNWNEVMGTPEGWKEIFNRPVAETIRQLGGGLSTEIPLPLNEFKRYVDGLRFQLIENWCLCKYCQLYDPTNESLGYWVSEFSACAKYLQDSCIKGEIDKRKTISTMFIDDYDYNQERKILVIIREKFDAEDIKDMSKRNAIAASFVTSIGDLIDLLAYTQTSIPDYIQATFQYQRS